MVYSSSFDLVIDVTGHSECECIIGFEKSCGCGLSFLGYLLIYIFVQWAICTLDAWNTVEASLVS